MSVTSEALRNTATAVETCAADLASLETWLRGSIDGLRQGAIAIRISAERIEREEREASK